ncbi:hypothetical protein THAOC_14738 [Thalassiosira oceanica]|uniref:Uncharacterized protein n=1 Tax=Thalassiosira oceanica TaxID=159749 RepID=K0SHR8_THAOC|nr:hypothetical protein THAOC_14738 [Thalassiosira oceanica]|eukprot:EJK64524.1 hypothetical protein THAOC_14738 [Thalassiosira oceanica]
MCASFPASSFSGAPPRPRQRRHELLQRRQADRHPPPPFRPASVILGVAPVPHRPRPDRLPAPAAGDIRVLYEVDPPDDRPPQVVLGRIPLEEAVQPGEPRRELRRSQPAARPLEEARRVRRTRGASAAFGPGGVPHGRAPVAVPLLGLRAVVARPAAAVGLEPGQGELLAPGLDEPAGRLLVEDPPPAVLPPRDPVPREGVQQVVLHGLRREHGAVAHGAEAAGSVVGRFPSLIQHGEGRRHARVGRVGPPKHDVAPACVHPRGSVAVLLEPRDLAVRQRHPRRAPPLLLAARRRAVGPPHELCVGPVRPRVDEEVAAAPVAVRGLVREGHGGLDVAEPGELAEPLGLRALPVLALPPPPRLARVGFFPRRAAALRRHGARRHALVEVLPLRVGLIAAANTEQRPAAVAANSFAGLAVGIPDEASASSSFVLHHQRPAEREALLRRRQVVRPEERAVDPLGEDLADVPQDEAGAETLEHVRKRAVARVRPRLNRPAVGGPALVEGVPAPRVGPRDAAAGDVLDEVPEPAEGRVALVPREDGPDHVVAFRREVRNGGVDVYAAVGRRWRAVGVVAVLPPGVQVAEERVEEQRGRRGISVPEGRRHLFPLLTDEEETVETLSIFHPCSLFSGATSS